MRKILVAGPAFYGYTESVAEGFEKNGFETRSIVWGKETDGDNLKEKLQLKFSTSAALFFQKKERHFNARLRNIYQEYKPDIVVIIRGAVLDSETLNFMKNSMLVLWMMDSIFSVKKTVQNVQLYNHVFLFEKEDIPRLKKEYGMTGIFLPLALDEKTYYPIPSTQKTIDILFVGALYPNRVLLLNKLIEKFPGKAIKVYGFYFSKLRDIKRWLFRKDKKYYLNKTVKPAQLNKLYSQTKLCLNIHHSQSMYGVNQRFFEVIGAKAFQVCDRHGFIEDNFTPREIELYDNDEQLFESIEKFFSGQFSYEGNIQTAYENVLANHTFSKRAAYIMQIIDGPTSAA